MPFESEKQRRYMFAKHPEIAKRWAAEGKAYVKKKPSTKKAGIKKVGKSKKG